jgi:hypothetical protein
MGLHFQPHSAETHGCAELLLSVNSALAQKKTCSALTPEEVCVL